MAFYNDYDLSELLYKKPVFETGFLRLEPEDDQQAHSHAKARSSETTTATNAATTPPPTTTVEARKPSQLKSAMKAAPQATRKTKDVERRPSFIEVSTPKVHHHEPEHRRHSSESHVPMSWWPEDETMAQHKWVEGERVCNSSGADYDCGSADEEEEIFEEEMFAQTFYD